MATDKSLNIRQTQATESLAQALIEVNERLEAIEATLDGIKAAMSGVKSSPQVGRLEDASRSVAKKYK